jgi:hypothetical protein
MTKIRIDLIKRMYEDHWYTVDDICDRLRYPKELVEKAIITYNIVKDPNHIRELK